MDKVSTEKRSEIMSSIRSVSSIEEAAARKFQLFGRLHVRRHPKGIFGNPDFGNKKRRIAVFVDGCFWHGCPECYREPKSNVAFWRQKVQRNRKRDGEVNRYLRDRGWTVFRIWEHELKGGE